MVEIKADPASSRMLIRLDRALTPEEFHQVIEQITAESDKLPCGWVAAVDMRGMWISDPHLNCQFRLLQQGLLVNGAGKIATLLDNAAVHMQLGQAGLKTHSNEITRRFYNEQEWESFMAEQEVNAV